MSLSCSCENDDAEWYYEADDDFSTLATKRSRRCCSCRKRIAVGDECVHLRRWRSPGYDTIEERIYGEDGEVALASWYLCETCGGLHWAVTDLDMCLDIDQNIAAQIKEYRAEEQLYARPLLRSER